MTTWTLFDYGVGNLHSLQKALERAGARTRITSDPNELAEAGVAVLPGVGAFGHVMRALQPASLALRARHESGRPILGICIGQQVLFEGSEESPGVPGIGIFAGTVKRLPAGAGKVPHMGWNTLQTSDPLLDAANDAYVYYVHSYAAPPTEHTTACTTYGEPFAAAVRAGNTIGYQFHPEKSSVVGEAILAETVRTLEAAA